MPIITAAALGALTAHAMTSRGGRAGYTRGTRTRARMRRTAYSASRYRKRYKKSSKRQWQARARRTVGVPRNYSTAKTAAGYVTTRVSKLDQRLAAVSCVRIARGTQINQRLRDSIVVSGVRIQFACRNQNGYTGFLNWAVVHPKDETTITQDQDDFFRDYNSDRAWSAGIASKNGQEWSNAAINTDKFDVLRRGKFMLGANPAVTTLNAISYNKDTEKEMDIYVKLGRTFTFDSTGSPTEPFENIYFCFWFASPLASTGVGVGDGILESTKIVTYFREPKSG